MEIVNENYEKKRETNIEILRILSMLMIVSHHFSVHGLYTSDTTSIVNNIWLQFLSSGGKIGVNIFIMITGYFLILSEKIQTKKILKMIMQMLFYSISIFIVLVFLNKIPLSFENVLNHVFCFNLWWFAKSYLILYILHPYINRFLNTLNKKEFQHYLILLFILLSLFSTLTSKALDDGTILWFVFIYSIGGYLKKYPKDLKRTSKSYICLSFTFYLLTFLITIIFDFLGQNISFFSNNSMYLFAMDRVTVLLISTFLFIGFSKLKISHNKYVNYVSSATFGVYLIHDFNYMRLLLWKDIFYNSNYINSLFLIPYSIFAIIIVYIICSIIELIRKYLLEKKYSFLVNELSIFIDQIVDKFLNSGIFIKK